MSQSAGAVLDGEMLDVGQLGQAERVTVAQLHR